MLSAVGASDSKLLKTMEKLFEESNIDVLDSSIIIRNRQSGNSGQTGRSTHLC